MTKFSTPQLKKIPPRPGDPRIAELIGTGTAPRIALIGFPVDAGVRINGGRTGAASAPDAIRQEFFNLTPDPVNDRRFSSLIADIRDLGNLHGGKDLEAQQEDLGRVVGDCLKKNVLPVILGGGHETAYGHFLGYVEAQQAVEIINWDAHPDVRELKDGKGHSGSVFRQALEHSSGLCRKYTAAGLHPHATARQHLDYILSRQGRYLWKEQLNRGEIQRLYRHSAKSTLVSFDLDLLDQAFAPGVSAPGRDGLQPELWYYAAYRAGICPAVTSFDIVELNPGFDRDAQTAKVAAMTLWYFLKGIAEARS